MEITPTESNNQNSASNNALFITDNIKSNLLTTASWSKFLAIIGFIGVGVMAIVSLIILIAWILSSSQAAIMGIYDTKSLTIITIIYMALAAIGFFICLYLYRFAKNVKEAIVDDSQMSLENAMMYQRKLYKFYGIMTIVYLGFIVVLYIVLLCIKFIL